MQVNNFYKIIFKATALELLKAAELNCVGNNLRCVIDPRNPNFVFKIPNFCIEDPVFEKDFSAKEQMANVITEKIIKIILFNFIKMEETEMTVSNKMKAAELKKLYAEKINLPCNKFKIRFIYRGKEILNDHGLFLHELENKSKIQVNITEL